VARSVTRKSKTTRGNSLKGSAKGKALAVSRPELLVDGSDRLFNKMINDLFSLRSMLNVMRDKRAEAVGLGGIEYGALLALARLPKGEIGVQELADRLRLSGAFTTSTVNVLVEKGLVGKAPHPSDKRRVLLSVTERGVALLGRFAPMRQQVNDVAFEALTAPQFHQFCDMINRLTQSTERALALQEYLLKGDDQSARNGRRK
jgi:DNA-binding MarR family transcriptional regulator